MKNTAPLVIIIIALALTTVGLVVYLNTRPYQPPYEHIYVQPTPAESQPPVFYDNLPIPYTNTTYGFSLAYPPTSKLLTSADQITQTGYIPVCDPDTSAACVVFGKDLYPKSNFDGVGVSVNIWPAAKTDKDCTNTSRMMQTDGAVTINGHTFQHLTGGDAAMSHDVTQSEYDGFIDGTCYHLVASLETTTFDVYAPGTITEFTKAQEADLQQQLTNVIMSFKK